MALLEWDEKLSVSIKEIDDQHKKLFDIINSLHAAMKQGKGVDVIEKIISELKDYTHYHFSAEETYMEKANYSEIRTHRDCHHEFVNKLEDFQRELDKSKYGVSIKVMRFLADWLVKHIKDTDQKYSAFIKE